MKEVEIKYIMFRYVTYPIQYANLFRILQVIGFFYVWPFAMNFFWHMKQQIDMMILLWNMS